jgi:hypothetical protein
MRDFFLRIQCEETTISIRIVARCVVLPSHAARKLKRVTTI